MHLYTTHGRVVWPRGSTEHAQHHVCDVQVRVATILGA